MALREQGQRARVMGWGRTIESEVKMKPSLELMERLKKEFRYLELMTSCFLDYFQKCNPPESLSQGTIDALFTFYIAGIEEVIRPGSKFNTEWRPIDSNND